MPLSLLLTSVGFFALGAVVATAAQQRDKGDDKAQIHGIGGIFFTAADPAATQAWYVEHLGVPEKVLDGGYRIPLIPWREVDRPDDVGNTVFAVFPNGAEHLEPSNAPFMINFRVRDLEGILGQVKAGGGTQVGEIQTDFNGRFAWFLDPDGRKVELWEPAEGY